MYDSCWHRVVASTAYQAAMTCHACDVSKNVSNSTVWHTGYRYVEPLALVTAIRSPDAENAVEDLKVMPSGTSNCRTAGMPQSMRSVSYSCRVLFRLSTASHCPARATINHTTRLAAPVPEYTEHVHIGLGSSAGLVGCTSHRLSPRWLASVTATEMAQQIAVNEPAGHTFRVTAEVHNSAGRVH